jgi:acyl-CoA reductase-like NAD-dependent aldehyde dehydrogenase
MNVDALDQALRVLKSRKDAWALLPVARKAEYVQGVIDGYARLARRQVEASNRAKGVPPDSPLAGEEWVHPYLTVRTLRLLRDSLRQIAQSGRPSFPRRGLRTRPDGQLVARVFPLNLPDRVLYQGFRGEIRMQHAVTEEDLSENMAAFYRQKNPAGKVALVLGAGNVAAIGPTDLAQKLFVEGQVCLFKHNPVNEYLAPFLEEAFGELIRDGFVRTCVGGADVGEFLCRHSDVDEIHITGSDRTYEAIVFGAGDDGQARKRANQPRLAKRITCELGNVTPVIVVPGPWSPSDIAFHAENIATQIVNNCGFNCLSSRVLIVHQEWPQAEALLQAIRGVLAALPQRPAYYPGAEKRYDEILAANPGAQAVGPRRKSVIPYTLIPGIDPADRDNPCFATECFMPILAETRLPGENAGEFLRHAVRFANETLWGTLSANLIVHPATARALGSQLEDAIAGLRYGTVAVNQWVAMGYVWGATSWGAYPGHAPADIQSGIGVVHNTFMFDKPEKSVVYGPFRVWPKPAWFAASPRMGDVFSRATELETRPHVMKALRIGLAAVWG